MSEWMETIDGRIIDVTSMDDKVARGRELILTDYKIKYGAAVSVPLEELKDESGTEDDLATIFKNMDKQVNDFFDRANEMFEEERDFYGRSYPTNV